jgi:4'-phosphopantetheinyl transferase
MAVTHGRLVGIDIEKIRPLADAEQLVARFFSANERAVFQGLPPEEKTAAFYNLWTRKEAWLKATGEGIGHLLDQVEVSFIPGKPAQFIRLPQTSPDAAGQWNLHDLSLPSGYAGAVTIRAPGGTPLRLFPPKIFYSGLGA